jgi:chromosome partitioning protein
MSYIIAVANGKGGVGKTTSTLSLGGALAERGADVLLLDLDPHANLTLSLGMPPGKLDRTVADILLSDKKPSDVILDTRVPNLTLIGANNELLMAERYLTLRDNYQGLLSQSLRNEENHRFILLDCPPALGALTQSALSASDLLVIPTQCEYYSAHALRDMLNQIRYTRRQSNARLRYRLLLTMLDRRNRIHRSLNDQIRSAFGKAVFNTAIEMDTRLRESPVFGQPITVYASGSRGASQYRELAQELETYAEEAVEKSPQSA